MSSEILRNWVANLPAVIRRAFLKFQKDLHTALPGRVESFDPVTQTATVQVMVKRIYIQRDGVRETKVPTDISALINVPVIFPRGGGFSLTFPVKKGDECLLVFNERCYDLWWKTGKASIPGAKRFHSFSDAVALVGFNSSPNLIPNYNPDSVELKEDSGDGRITLSSGGVLEIQTSASVTVNSPSVSVDCETVDVTASTSASVASSQIDLTGTVTVTGSMSVSGALSFNGGASGQGDLSTSGDISTASGDITADGISLKTHTHPGHDQPPQ